MNQYRDLLDRIDPHRFDVDDIVDMLNAFSELPVSEQDSYEMGSWGYAGLDQAAHPLGAMCGEAHNDFAVVRDLDGSLQFLFETAPGSQSWKYGPLYRHHISELELEAYLDSDSPDLDTEVGITWGELRSLLELLPDDPPGPVRSY